MTPIQQEWREALGRYEAGRRRDPANSYAHPSNHYTQRFARFILPHLFGKILDVGCGPTAHPYYLRGVAADRLVGIDPLPPIEHRQFASAYAVGEALPFCDGVFDTVICATVLDHCSDPRKVVQEMSRVSKAGGKLLIVETAGPDGAEPDEHHPWRFTRTQLMGLVSRYYRLERMEWHGINDGLRVGYMNHYGCWEKRSALDDA